ncbi:MAG TPA: AAA family ATPase [Thermoguttaceae bacterium]|nr:AAA family ATPase [Thermoguttaceae bacterium]
MKLDRLKIKSRFKNLSDFEIDFDKDSSTTVVVGRNGTGKSNLLEALTIIFRDLDLGERPLFGYELDYVCRGKLVRIDADPQRRQHSGYSVTVDDSPLTFNKFREAPGREFLPNYIFGYYSGPSDRMEEHYLKHQERFYRDLLAGKDQPLRPLFYARPVHSQFVLLAFFMEQEPEVLDFLREHLWIEGLDYALFVMRQPPWTSRQGDARFWNARGVVSDFLDKLYELALAPLRLKLRIPIGFRKTTQAEHLYLYLKDLADIRNLARKYDSQQAFFKALESTYISRLISEVRMNVKARKVDGSLTFRELSEGEQQLLMVLGLLRFTREEESLFLLDEPDTHLNPAWSIRYLEFLRSIGGAQETSHIIMVTHDPLVIAGLTKSEVQILDRDEESGRVTAKLPDQDPRGMGVAALLTSEVYGLRSQLDLDTLQALDRKRQLASKDDLSDEERVQLRDLDQRLGHLDFTLSARDPLYEQFVRAMSQRQREAGLTEPVLSPQQQEEVRDLALQVIRELTPGEEAS